MIPMSSDPPVETSRVAVSWCPTCEPGRDPSRELLDTYYCAAHTPDRSGADDGQAGDPRPLNSAGEAEAFECRAIQQLIRIRKKDEPAA